MESPWPKPANDTGGFRVRRSKALRILGMREKKVPKDSEVRVQDHVEELQELLGSKIKPSQDPPKNPNLIFWEGEAISLNLEA